MKTIVSISPVKVEADSRTFKQAASITSFGYTSIVVEGQRSTLERKSLPFQLYSLENEASSNGDIESALGEIAECDAQDESETRAALKRALNRHGLLRFIQLRYAVHGFLKTIRAFVNGFCQYLYHFCILPLRYTPRASLYFLHSPLQFPAVYILSRWYRVPFIYDAHDFYSRMEENDQNLRLEKRWLKSIYSKIESWCIKKAAAVVTVSEGIAELQEREFSCRPVVIRNCQDSRLDRPPARDLRSLLGLSPDKFLLVTVGQAKPGQALREGIEAMSLLPDRVHLALLGKGYEEHLDEIREKRLEGRIHLVEPVKPYEVVPFIRSADASLTLYYSRSANYVNCLPNGLFQSITAELPLLYPELRYFKKISEQYDLGIAIDTLSAESIRSGVLELLSSPDKVLRYKRNLRVAKQELSWENEEILLKDLILRIMR